MNYIAQINAFENWLEYNELSAGPQLLWYKIMHVANKSGWQSELSIANTRLQSLTKCSEKSLINNRNLLIQNGLLQYKKRGRTKAGIYILTDLTTGKTTVKELTTGKIPVDVTVKREVDTEVDSTVETEVNTSAYINKTKLNKTKQNLLLSEAEEKKVTLLMDFIKEKWKTNQIPMPLIASLSDWVLDWDEGVLQKAFEIALNNPNVKIYGLKGYVAEVLNSWEKRGVKNVSDIGEPTSHNHKKSDLPWWSDMTNEDWEEYEKMTDAQRKERGWSD